MPDTETTSGSVREASLTGFLGVGGGLGLCAAAIFAAGGRDPRLPAQAWLVAHGSGITVSDASIRIVPLGATLLCVAWVAWLARRLGRAVGIDGLGPYVGIVAAIYGVVAAGLAAVVTTDTVMISIPRAAIAAFLAGGAGAALGAGWRHRRALPIGPDATIVLRGAARAVGGVLAAALVGTLGLLAWHGQRAGELWGLLDPGPLGDVALGLACLLSIPTLVLWCASVLVGPGFAVGTGTSVTLAGASLGAVPGFPTLAALPSPGQFDGWVLVFALIGPVAGIWAGTVTSRPKLGAAAGAVGGLVLGLAIALSGGGIGPGRMADAGPDPLTSVLIAVPALAVCGALGAWLCGVRQARAS